MDEDPLEKQDGTGKSSRDFFLSMSHEYLRSQAANLSQVDGQQDTHAKLLQVSFLTEPPPTTFLIYN